MMFPKLLLNIRIIFVVATVLLVKGQSTLTTTSDYRLPDNVMPLHYDIKLKPHIKEDSFTFDGECSIIIVIRNATRNIRLHKLDLTIDEAVTFLSDIDGVIYPPVEHLYNDITEILEYNFGVQLEPGDYTLNMKFTGILHNDFGGFFRTSYKNEKGDKVWLAATYFVPTWARRAFPCLDEPSFKATFNISIKHHRNYTALSNMPARDQSNDSDEDGMMWTHFQKTPTMSTYLVAFVVTDYINVYNTDETIKVWCRPQLAQDVSFVLWIALLSGMMLKQYTETYEKVPKIDHVIVPRLPVGVSENWGLIIYQEDETVYNIESHTTIRKHNVAETVVHEMAYQWFNNIVSPQWWSHMWLSEGFATLFEKYILNRIYQEWRMMDLFIVEIHQHALILDVGNLIVPITSEVNSPREISSIFTKYKFYKAPAILRMLQHIIGDEVFRRGVIDYLRVYQFSSATSDDLWNILQQALDKSDVPHDNYQLKDVMDTWINQRNYPVVIVTRNYDTGDTILRQQHFRRHLRNKDKTLEQKWWIPLTFATQTKPDFSKTLPTHWLKPDDKNITIGGIKPNDWIIVNLQRMGYYLVNYDPTNWQKISDYLNSEEYENIHVLNRAQIIFDTVHLLLNNQLDPSIFANIINYLSRETDYIPWCSMFYIFGYIEEINFSKSVYNKEKLHKIMDRIVSNVGFEENSAFENDFSKLKRIDVLKWACTFGHSECIRMATVKLIEHLTDPEKYKVAPNLKEWTYCMGMMEANASTWNKMMDIYIKNPTTENLRYLSCSENPDIIINFLNVSTAIGSTIQEAEYKNVYKFVVEKHADKDAVLEYILTNHQQVISRGVDMKHGLRVIIDNVYSEKKLNKIRKFGIYYFDSSTKDEEWQDGKVLLSIKDMIHQRKAELLRTSNLLQNVVSSFTGN